VNNPKYPNIVDDYRETFRRLKKMNVDIFLASHGSMFNLEEKRRAIGEGKPSPFVVHGEFATFMDQAERNFEKQVAAQESTAK
jgi:metallo-beta-lactamase class B